MDDSWLAKCIVAPPQLPPISGPATGPVPTPASQAVPSQLASMVPAAAPAGQVHVNIRRHSHSFVAQESLVKDHTGVQETATISTFNLGSYRMGKKELDNSFLALLSGGFSQFPTSKTDIARLQVGNDDNALSGSGCVVPSVNIPPLPENHGNSALGNWSELSSFVASRSSVNSTSTKVPFIHNNVRLADNSYHDTSFVEFAPQKLSRCKNTGFAVNSTRNGWMSSSRSPNSNKHPIMDVQASQIISFQGKPPISHKNTSFLKGRLVFCRNTVGELFMGDTGLFGVICFCHSSHMSVAKFCEHSGSTSVNPGEAVYLENGMSISHWSKQCLGIVAPDNAIGWEWSGALSAKGVLVNSEASNAPTLLNNFGTINNINKFAGSWRSIEPLNNFGPCHQYAKVGCTAKEESLTKQQENQCQKYDLDGRNLFQEMISNPVQVSMLSPTNNQPRQEVKQSAICVSPEKSHSALPNGREIQLETHGVNHTGKCVTHSVSFTHLETNKTMRHDGSIGSSSFSSEASMADKDCVSNIELRLGQPSQKCHTFAGSLPMSLQFGSMCDQTKPKLHQLKEEIDNTCDAKKTWQNLHSTPLETSLSNKRLEQHASRTVDGVIQSEVEDLTHDANKNPLISLFLSHLEGNNTSLSLDNILSSSDHLSSKMPSSDSPSIGGNTLNSVGDFTDIIQRKSRARKLGFSNSLDERKNLLDVDKGIERSDCIIQNNQASDTREPTTSCSGYGPCILRDDGQSSFYQNPSTNMPHKRGLKNTKVHDKTSFNSHKDYHHAFHASSHPIPYGMVGTDSLNSDIPMSSTTVCSLDPNRKVFSTTKHFADANLKKFPFEHAIDLSTQEYSSSSIRTNPPHHKLCCLSSSHTDGCPDDLAMLSDSRIRTYCRTYHDGSDIAVRSVSSCFSCQSSCGMDIFAGHPCHAGLTRSCNCLGSTKRTPLNPEKYCRRFCNCCTCDADKQPCLRLGKLANNCFLGGVNHEICNHKEHCSCLSGHFYSSVLPYCVQGLCTSGVNNTTNDLNALGVHSQTNIAHSTPDHGEDYLPLDCKRICLAYCDCSKSNIIHRSDRQTAFWRDVPKKAFAHAGTSTGKLAQALEITKNVDCSTECNRTYQEFQSMRGQQMSNMSAGSSAPVITEVSNEDNNLTSCMANTRSINMIQDFMVDEGSGNEKCGSSDEAVGDRECNKSIHFVGKVDAAKSGLHRMSGHSSADLINDRLKNTFKTKRVKEINEDFTSQEMINHKKCERTHKGSKESIGWNRSTISVPLLDISVAPETPDNVGHLDINNSRSQENEVSLEPGSAMPKERVSSCGSSSVKRKRSALSFSKSNFLKKSGNQHKLPENDNQFMNDSRSVGRLDCSNKKTKQALAVCTKHQNFISTGKPPKFMSLNCIGNTSSNEKTTLPNKNRPVVCGNSGIITCGGTVGDQKPAKIISLSLVLKKAKRCSPTETYCTDVNQERVSLSWQVLQEKPTSSDLFEDRQNSKILIISGDSKESSTEKVKDSKSSIDSGLHLHPKQFKSQSRSKHKDVRTRSLNKLAAEHTTTKITSLSTCGTNCSNLIQEKDQINISPSTTMGVHYQDKKLDTREHLGSALPTVTVPSPKKEDYAGKVSQVNRRRFSRHYRCPPFRSNLDAFCCVCGSSNQEDTNQLLECHDCLIKVHQACYGIPKIPKGHWCCRPCKANSHNMVCVLCGYGGGAMTRALKSQNIIKGLLKAWKVSKGSYSVQSIHSENADNEFSDLRSEGEILMYNKCGSVPCLVEAISDSPQAASKLDFQKQADRTEKADATQSKKDSPENFQDHNSIIAGVLDPSVTQWVHMVCGLWTPGTRCPNVDTMSTFDVSGALPCKKNIACSICNRPGGSCIECRVPSCSVPFHPWCANQKGLLQSEVEGDDNENVGFYGRCLHHATLPNSSHLASHAMDAEELSRNNDGACARIEGFKGRKRERGRRPNPQNTCKGGGACIVSQEQINAWLHINGHCQKSCSRGMLKPQCSDVECDFRKEYIRYKQSKGWKHLVVYKSGIHALGLYTSQFIARGAMVVEYIGEIVGLRVADKREAEYQSGRRIQYKSACYFFRINKEHIIDATRKGGIARFVNHSCLPNCVAKVISVRNEKKVVFFAERDINPGEEITYDYHFNSEDEGKKIPCFCNSKNCRRYLN